MASNKACKIRYILFNRAIQEIDFFYFFSLRHNYRSKFSWLFDIEFWGCLVSTGKLGLIAACRGSLVTSLIILRKNIDADNGYAVAA